TINQATTQADPTNTSPIHFTVVFSEVVAGFTTSNIALSGSAGPTSETISVTNGATYDVAVIALSSNGTVTASITSGTVHDAAGNVLSTGSTSTDNTVTY